MSGPAFIIGEPLDHLSFLSGLYSCNHCSAIHKKGESHVCVTILNFELERAKFEAAKVTGTPEELSAQAMRLSEVSALLQSKIGHAGLKP